MQIKNHESKASQAERINATFTIAVKHGRLQINVDLPFYVILLVLSAVAVSAGYPIWEQVAKALLHG